MATCARCLHWHPSLHCRGAQGANITKFEDFKGKRSTSATRVRHAGVVNEMLAAMGWKMSDFGLALNCVRTSTARRCATARSTASSMPSATRPPTSGPDHDLWREARVPDRAGRRQTGEGKAVLRHGDDPGGMYPNNRSDDHLWRAATIVSSAKVPADVVYVVVKTVFDNLDDSRSCTPHSPT